MKNVSLLLLSLSLSLHAQTQLNLLGHWVDPTIPGTTAYDNPFNEVWGVVADGREIAIIGSTLGTHFIDVTEPENLQELEAAFVPGAAQGAAIIHRDFHDFQGYLYAVSDEGASTLQVIDLAGLPDTTEVVYDSDQILRTAHNIFIDSATAKMYVCGTITNGIGYAPLRIVDLSEPTQPQLLKSVNQINGVNLPYVHDAFVRNDTAYLNCGFAGLYVVDFGDVENPVLLGTMTDYPQNGYNHSGWLHPEAPVYYLGDESHGFDLKTVDVTNLMDLFVETTFDAGSTHPSSIPHNLLVRGDRLYVSYYYDGLQVYDISDPLNPQRIGFYPTSTVPHKNSYEGAWGVYPYLPSDNILVSDMQEGLFVIEDGGMVVAVENPSAASGLQVFPNPATDYLQVEGLPERSELWLVDGIGRVWSSWDVREEVGGIRIGLPGHLPKGVYFLHVKSQAGVWTEKVIVQGQQ